jgi:hypothetical protein
MESEGKRQSGRRCERGRTLSHEMPPRCIQGIIRPPPSDILAVRCTRIVLVDVRRTERSLRVQRGERVHIAAPTAFPGIILVYSIQGLVGNSRMGI